MDVEVLLIIAVFGGILAIMLYKYLLQSPEVKTETAKTEMAQPRSSESDVNVLEPLAERVYTLFEKVEVLEKNFSSLESYLQQKVEIWKKERAKELKQ